MSYKIDMGLQRIKTDLKAIYLAHSMERFSVTSIIRIYVYNMSPYR